MAESYSWDVWDESQFGAYNGHYQLYQTTSMSAATTNSTSLPQNTPSSARQTTLTEDTGPSDPYQGFSDVESATQTSAPPADGHLSLDPRLLAPRRGPSPEETWGPRGNLDNGPVPSAYTEADGGITATTDHAGFWHYNAGGLGVDAMLDMMPMDIDGSIMPSSVGPVPDLGHNQRMVTEAQLPDGPPAPEHYQDTGAVGVFHSALGNPEGSWKDAKKAVALVDQAFGNDGLVCSWCQGTFKNKASLKHHEKSHIPDLAKKFKCTLCDDMGFRYPKDLKRHKDTVHNKLAGTFVCNVCGRAYKRRDHRKRHLENKHPSSFNEKSGP